MGRGRCNPRRPPPRYLRRTISRRSHEKIGDCEQSTLTSTPTPSLVKTSWKPALMRVVDNREVLRRISHDCKISGSQQSFLTQFLTKRPWNGVSVNLSNNGRKVWATVLFLGAFMHSKVIHVNFFDFFFYDICRITVCWDLEILLPWPCGVTTSRLYI